MNEKDIQILKTLEDLETTSTEAVSNATGIPLSTIHYRLNNLRDAGVIKNDRLDLGLDEFGLGVTILVEVFTNALGKHIVGGKPSCDFSITMTKIMERSEHPIHC